MNKLYVAVSLLLVTTGLAVFGTTVYLVRDELKAKLFGTAPAVNPPAAKVNPDHDTEIVGYVIGGVTESKDKLPIVWIANRPPNTGLDNPMTQCTFRGWTPQIRGLQTGNRVSVLGTSEPPRQGEKSLVRCVLKDRW